jgi:nickel-type superoxide dismutase maturation protease
MTRMTASNQGLNYFPELMVGLLAAGLVVWWRLRSFRIEVHGASMAPTLEPGEYLFAVRVRSVSPGSLVVVEHPNRPGHEMVKRVEAGPGERASDRILGPDEYWVTGDNRDRSTDSRSFGVVRRKAIRGRVVLRYWPLSRASWLG